MAVGTTEYSQKRLIKSRLHAIMGNTSLILTGIHSETF